MIRIVFYILILTAAVAAALWLADRPGDVTVNWEGYRITTSVAFAAFCLAVFGIVTAIVYRFWSALRRAPAAYGESRRNARRQRGYKALTQGMVAVAAGDAEEAARQARRADVLLSDPPLTMLLSAQTAQLQGDEDAARKYFEEMLKNPETAFLGVRGLLMQARKAGDTSAALSYARDAYRLRPKTPWVLKSLFELQVAHARWTEALSTLDEAVKRGAMPAADGRAKKAVVLLGSSIAAERSGDARNSAAQARKAYELDRSFLPAILRWSRILAETARPRPATRIVQNAWSRRPHPGLARIYGDLVAKEAPLKRVARFEKLLTFNPGHAESHLALADAALDARLWGQARNHLVKAEAALDVPTARLCRMMAELEEAEHGDLAKARPWLLRAAGAEPDPAWVCGDCGAAWAEWTPVCAGCGALGSLDWRTPQRARGVTFERPQVAALPSADATDVEDIDADADDLDDDAIGEAGPGADGEAPPNGAKKTATDA